MMPPIEKLMNTRELPEMKMPNNKFIDLFGDEVVEKEAKDEYVKKVLAISKQHFSKYGYKKMSQKEFKELFELN